MASFHSTGAASHVNFVLEAPSSEFMKLTNPSPLKSLVIKTDTILPLKTQRQRRKKESNCFLDFPCKGRDGYAKKAF